MNYFFKKRKINNFQTHNFRATRITNIYGKKKDIVAVSKWVGHTSIKTTQDYIKIDAEKSKREFAAMLTEDAETN